MKMIVCWASATCFQFHSRQFACWLAEEIIQSDLTAICGDVCCISAFVSDYNMPYSLKNVYYFNILGGVKLAYVVSTTRCICPVSSGMRPRPPPKAVFVGHLHLVFSGSDSYPFRKKRMKWPGVNSPLEFFNLKQTNLTWVETSHKIYIKFCLFLFYY